MAETTIPPSGLSDNDLADLSALLSLELRVFQEKHPVYRLREYYGWLNVLVGIGYTAILAEGSDVCERVYRSYIDEYLAVRETAPRILTPAAIEKVSEIIPKMMKEAVSAFSLVRFPEYYDYFAEAAKKLISRVVLHVSEEDAEGLDEKADWLTRYIDRGCRG